MIKRLRATGDTGAGKVKKGSKGLLGREDKTRQKIVDASIRYMAAHGSEKMNMIDVAKLAKVARATVYNYFESKDVLLNAVEKSLEGLFFASLREEVYKHRQFEDRIAAMAIFIRKSWTDREHTPWYGFLSPVDEAMLIASSAPHHIRKLAEFAAPLLKDAIKFGEVRPRINVNLACLWISRIVFSFALESPEKKLDEPMEILSLFKNFLVDGMGPER